MGRRHHPPTGYGRQTAAEYTGEEKDMTEEDFDLEDFEETEDTEMESEQETESSVEQDDDSGSDEIEDVEESEPEKESKTVPRAALISERRKAQELKKRLEAYETQRVDTNEPDPLDDPEAYKSWAREQARVEFVNQQKNEFNERATADRDLMLEKHDDYEEMEEVFYNLAQREPELQEEMFNSRHPAQFAYEEAKAYQEMIDQKTEERLLAKLRAEGKLKEDLEETETEPKRKRTPSLAKVTAQESNIDDKESYKGLDELDEMFDNVGY